MQNFQFLPVQKKCPCKSTKNREKRVLPVQILGNLHPCKSKKCTCKFWVIYTRANQKVPVQIYIPSPLKFYHFHDFLACSEGGFRFKRVVFCRGVFNLLEEREPRQYFFFSILQVLDEKILTLYYSTNVDAVFLVSAKITMTMFFEI